MVMNIEPGFYADNLHLQKSANDEKSLDTVAKEFEALYLQMMLKSMRDAGKAFQSNLMSNDYTDKYEEMYHNQLAKDIAYKAGFGLADAIKEQMLPHIDKTANISEQPISEKAISEKIAIKPYVNHTVTKQQLDKFTTFATPREFIDKLTPEITQAANKIGVAPQLLLAQAALESGWGQHTNDSRNLFGIKADNVWQKGKDFVNTTTHEFVDGVKNKVVDKFRAYKNYKDSIQDYVSFIQSNPRYQKALSVSNDPQQYMQELQKAGYATDPEYANKVLKIYDKIKGSAT
jgi:flagellar protein FlgJ